MDSSLRHEKLSPYHDSGRNLVLLAAGEITAAQDALGSEGVEKVAEIFAHQNEQLLETLELREQAQIHFGIGMSLLLPIAPKTTVVDGEKKGNTTARSLTGWKSREVIGPGH